MEVARIRQLAIEMLPECGFSTAEPSNESILIKDGHYIGRHFHFEGVQAVWLLEGNRLEFYSDTGKLLKLMRLDGPLEYRKAG